MTDGLSGLHRQARTLAGSLPALLAEANRVAAALKAGAHGRRRSGPGEAFWQFRRYQPGDPADEIDWRASAKSDALYVRETEWEAAETVWFWVDPSASMRWRSRETLPEKRQRGLVLALALAVLLREGGEGTGVLGRGSASWGQGGIESLAADLLALPAPSALPEPPAKRGGQIVLISDFLAPPEVLTPALERLGAVAFKGHLLHLLDPAEIDLPYRGRVRFQGLEGENEILAPRAEDLRRGYALRLEALCRDLRQTASTLGWNFLSATTGDPPLAALASLHTAMRGH